MSVQVPAVDVPRAATAESPWPGLLAFEEGDQAFFKGREEQISSLLRRIAREDLTLLWGLSGLGKTSLLRAGLFPRLREAAIFPVYVRLRYASALAGHAGSEPPPPTLVEQCFEAIRQSANRWGYETPRPAPSGTMWEYVRRRDERFWGPGDRMATPLLVLDQFEELFTHGQGDASTASKTTQFFQDISAALTGSGPDWLLDPTDLPRQRPSDYLFQPGVFKVLLSFREDFLAHVTGFRTLVHAVDSNYYRLESMSPDQGLAVVAEAGGHLIADDPPGERGALCRLILDRVAPASPAGTPTVDPALLSLFCSELNETRRSQGKPAIDRAIVESGATSEIISAYYDARMREVGEVTRRFVEDQLTLRHSRSRNSVAEESALEAGAPRAEVDQLIRKRILRREETRRGQPRLELTHDVLVEPALAARGRREIEEQRLGLERAEREQAEQKLQAEARERQAKEFAFLDDLAQVRKRRNVVLSGLAFLLLCAVVGIAFLAITQFKHSVEHKAQRYTQEANARLMVDPRLSTMLASRAVKDATGLDGSAPSMAWAALLRSVRQASPVYRIPCKATSRRQGALAVSPDGKRLALIDDTGRSVSIRERREAWRFDQESAPLSAFAKATIRSVHFLSDGQGVLLVNADGSFDRLADWSNPVSRNHTLPPGEPAASGVSVVPDELGQEPVFDRDSGRLLAVSFLSSPQPTWESQSPLLGPAQQWPQWTQWRQHGSRLSVGDIRTGQWKDLALVSDGSKIVLSSSGKRYAIVAPDGWTTLKDLDGHDIARTRFNPEHSGGSEGAGPDVLLSPEGSHVLALARASASVDVWDVERKETWRMVLPDASTIMSLEFSSNNRAVAVVQETGIAQVWDLTTRAAMRGIPFLAKGILFSQDATEILTWDERYVAQLWQLGSTQAPLRLAAHHEPIIAAALPADKGPILTMSASEMLVWSRDPIDRTVRRGDKGQANGGAIALGRDGTSLACAEQGRISTFFSSQAVNDLPPLPDVMALAYAPGGKTLAAGLRSGTIRLLPSSSGASEAPPISDGRGAITSIAFGSTGTVIAYGIAPHDTGHGIVVVRDVSTHRILSQKIVVGRILAVAVSSDGGRYAVGVLAPQRYAHDVTSGTSSTLGVSFEPFGSRSPSTDMSDDGSKALRGGPETSQQAASLVTAAQSQQVENVPQLAGISSDLKLGVSTNGERSIKVVLDYLAQGLSADAQVPVSLPFEQRVTAVAVAPVVAVAPHKSRFAVGGEEGLVKLYAAASLRDPVILEPKGSLITALAFSDDGDHLACVRADGTITLYSFSPESIRATASGRTQGPLSPDERASLGDLAWLDGPTSWRDHLESLITRVVMR